MSAACQYIVYILKSLAPRLHSSSGRTYVGLTNNLARRLRQHNGHIAGGARYTRAHRPWAVHATVEGFRDARDARQFEWYMHHPRAKVRGRGLNQSIAGGVGGARRPCIGKGVERRVEVANGLIGLARFAHLTVHVHYDVHLFTRE